MTWTYYWASGGHAAQPLYNQFQYNGCYVGCGPVAWAMLFCWADWQAANGNAYWAPRWGLYRENGGRGNNVVAPLTQDTGVSNIIKEINGQVGTFCITGSGATLPSSMGGASAYLSGRTGTSLGTHYNVLGISEDRLREYARNSIRDRATPAVIGTGWLTHYPMAYGYAWQQRTVRHEFLFWSWEETVYDRWFYVNQGWGGSGNGWVSADTWFAGEIYP
ncbi:hypothetical protein EPN18_06095 [bacterium]|nr:MAG: hypothetical protein EPN18_06095 [bacterium]